jgi:hypothetical protein
LSEICCIRRLQIPVIPAITPQVNGFGPIAAWQSGDSCSLFGRLRVQDRPDYVPFDGKTVFDSDEMIDK